MRSRSLLWPSLWAALGVLLLAGLGTWQLERLQWKEGLIAAREAGLHAPTADLPETLDEARAREFHPVRADGEFLNEHELYLHAASKRGELGYHIVTPLLLADGSVLLVDRGFVPSDHKTAATRLSGEPTGVVKMSGLLRLAPEGKPGWFTPDNDAAGNSWYYVDIPAMAQATGLARVLPYYVDAAPNANPAILPQGGQTITDLPNDHLQYALTWYALAVALVVIYIRFARRRLKETDPDSLR